MILADSREPKNLVDLLRRYTNKQVQYATQQLDCGDYMWEGECQDGPGLIGCERKKVADCLTSERSGRLQEQLGKMADAFDISLLIVEGEYRPDITGFLEDVVWRKVSRKCEIVKHARINLRNREQRSKGRSDYRYASELHKFLMSTALIGRVTILRSLNELDTAQQIANAYAWFSKPWDKHSSLQAVKFQADSVFRKASTLRMMAAQLPHIGWGKAKEVDQHFGTVERMVAASLDDWLEIPGIGSRIASDCFNALREKG